MKKLKHSGSKIMAILKHPGGGTPVPGLCREQATPCFWHYNNERPNMALGGITPRPGVIALPRESAHGLTVVIVTFPWLLSAW